MSEASSVAIEEQSTATGAMSEPDTRSAPDFEHTPFEVAIG